MTEKHRIREIIVRLAVLALILGSILGVIYVLGAWINVPQGTALLIVDTTKSENDRISQPILGPAAGLLLNGFLRLTNQQYPIGVYYATDSYEDTIPCFSKDQLEMNVTVTMRWQIDVTRIVSLYKSYPRLDYEATTIDSVMEKILRFNTKNYTALETVAKRPELSEEVKNAVFAALETEPSLNGALSHLEFDLKNIAYPPAYTDSIEAKLVSEQQKIQADFERERTIIQANATATADIIRATATAQTKVIEAQGVQDAMTLLISINPELNATRVLEFYEKQLWLNTLKNLNVPVIIMGVDNNGMPFILNIPTNSTTP